MGIKLSKDVILKRDVGQEFSVYNGKEYVSVFVYATMLGHKYGEFILTRKKFNLKKRKGKGKGKGKEK